MGEAAASRSPPRPEHGVRSMLPHGTVSQIDPLAGIAACVRGSARRDGAGASVLACHGTKPPVTLADLCCLGQFRRARR
jgi:hypothetical protein